MVKYLSIVVKGSKFASIHPMFRLILKAVGKPTEAWQEAALSMYLLRLSPYATLKMTEVAEGHQGSAKPDLEKTRKNEAEKLLKGLPENAFIVALDETGKSFSSEVFATKLADWNQGGRTVVFLIGGSWGLHEDVRKHADATLALGPMTMPHNIARIVLLEQIYRAAMIQNGKMYHK